MNGGEQDDRLAQLHGRSAKPRNDKPNCADGEIEQPGVKRGLNRVPEERCGEGQPGRG